MKSLPFLLLACSLASAQTQSLYHLPFASQGNTVEVLVTNGSTIPATDLALDLINVPSWLRFSTARLPLASLLPGKESIVRLLFAVDKQAPVGKDQPLSLVIASPSGQLWSKSIQFVVDPPQHFELVPNYPNPFNPSTVIGYLLPVESKVSLRIYDLMGREIDRLSDKIQPAGYHEQRFDGRSAASGVYIVRLIAEPEQGERFIAQRKIVLAK